MSGNLIARIHLRGLGGNGIVRAVLQERIRRSARVPDYVYRCRSFRRNRGLRNLRRLGRGRGHRHSEER